MSRENVEVVRRVVEAWQHDDLETWLSLMDPDMEYHPAIERGLEGGASVYRGHDGMREFWTLWRSEVDNYVLESQELRDHPLAAALNAGLRRRARSGRRNSDPRAADYDPVTVFEIFAMV